MSAVACAIGEARAAWQHWAGGESGGPQAGRAQRQRVATLSDTYNTYAAVCAAVASRPTQSRYHKTLRT